MASVEQADVAIIGGGYYGAFVATEIKQHYPAADVLVLEKDDTPFQHASSSNQGQFHMGYMYSADRRLAEECAANADRFRERFGEAIDQHTYSLYGIHEDSEISADEYAAFCDTVGLNVREIKRPENILGEAVGTTFETEEKTFNSAKLQAIFANELAAHGVRLTTGFRAQAIEQQGDALTVAGEAGELVAAEHVFNVTFADINALHERSGISKLPLRYDAFLHFVLDLPEQYRHVGATVIRGPFASLLPSDFRNGHVLASGNFRRVETGLYDKPEVEMSGEESWDIYERVLRDTIPYLPLLKLANYQGYTLGTRAAFTDPAKGSYTSKAVVFKDYDGIKNYHAVLGGKVACMFDVSAPVLQIFGSTAAHEAA